MATRAASFSADDVRRSFEEEWPELARRLERFLAAKGVERWFRADVIQETATRLYPRWETLDHSVPLWNLAATIAVRVVHNHRRKESRVELVADPVPIHRDDVHVRGLQRAQLDKTRSALQHLTTDQRRVLLAEVGESLVPSGTRNRVNVLRLRARARLREALGPWAPSGIVIRLRQLRAHLAQKNFALEIEIPAMANLLANVVAAATFAIAATAGWVDGPWDAADVADFPRQDAEHLLSMAQVHDADLHHEASIRRSTPPALSNAKQRPNEGMTGASDPLADAYRDAVERERQTEHEARRKSEDTYRETVDAEREAEREARRKSEDTYRKAVESEREAEREAQRKVEDTWP